MKMTERYFFSILITYLLNIILVLEGEIMSWSLLGLHERVNSQMIQRNRTLIWAELRLFFLF